MNPIEHNIDGLIGPTHFFGGLGAGNVASEKSAGNVSHPKAAAMQGLAKMKLVADLGVGQYVMPPHPRPALFFLRKLGYTGGAKDMLADVIRDQPVLLPIVYSSSAMWAANAATTCASVDAADGRVHFTPANLISNAHRALEADFTSHALKRIFRGDHFQHHPPLPYNPIMRDEGAANHMRLQHGDVVVHVLVYGASNDTHPAPGGGKGGALTPSKYVPRQHMEANKTLAKLHALNAKQVVHLQQHPDAIDAGVFHNDVIATSNGHLLIYYEQAYVDDAQLKAALSKGQFHVTVVTNEQLSLAEAVKSYLFNSQILIQPNGQMILIAPEECRQSQQAKALIDRWVGDASHPIAAVQYVDINQSMSNGGGPACLRLRLWLTEEEVAHVHPGVVFSDVLYEQLGNIIEQHYPEQVTAEDLHNPAFGARVLSIFETLAEVFNLPNLYGGWV